MALRTTLLLLACSRALAIARKREGPQLTDEDRRPSPRRAGAGPAGPQSAKDRRPSPQWAGAGPAGPQSAKDTLPNPPRARSWTGPQNTKEKLLEQLTNQHEEQLWQEQRKHRRETSELMGRLERNKQVIHDAEEAHARVEWAMAAIRRENEQVVDEAHASEAKAGGQIKRLSEENMALKEKAQFAKTQNEEMEKQMRKQIAVLEAKLRQTERVTAPLQEEGRASAQSALAIQEQIRQLHRDSRANTQLVERVISRAESLVERLRAENADLTWQARAAMMEAKELKSKVARSLLTMHGSDQDNQEVAS